MSSVADGLHKTCDGFRGRIVHCTHGAWVAFPYGDAVGDVLCGAMIDAMAGSRGMWAHAYQRTYDLYAAWHQALGHVADARHGHKRSLKSWQMKLGVQHFVVVLTIVANCVRRPDDHTVV